MNQGKAKRPRAVSAKQSHQKSRPSSAHRTSNKVQFIDNAYTNLLTSKRQGKTQGRVGTYFGDQIEQKPSFMKGYKQPQSLKEENIILKRQLNNLKEQLGRQKGKTQVFRRKNSQYTKKLNVEYQKELYWTNNNSANMVMGIKNQYQKIKQRYEQKCEEIEQLVKQNSTLREDKEFYQELLFENNKLVKRLKEADQELRLLRHGTLTSEVEETLQAHQKHKFQLNQINQTLETQRNQVKQSNKLLTQMVAQRDRKIQFLDKHLITKENDYYAARRQLKKVEKQKKAITQQYAEYKREKEQIINMLESKGKRNRDMQQKKARMQSQIFKKQIQQKNSQIQKLQKEVAYLATLMSYWKPLDEANKIAAEAMMQRNNNSSIDRQIVLEYSIGSTMIKLNRSKNQLHHREEDEVKSMTRSINQSRKGSTDINKHQVEQRNVNQAMAKSIDIRQNYGENQKRIQITADKRQTEQGVKSRKVRQEDIEDICQTLRFRFIGLDKPIEEVRQLFDYKTDGTDNMLDDEDEQNWKKQYISMRQISDILLSNPIFGLSEADALLLSRYLIEDSPTDYVYCDPNNQNIRSIVKSIIKKSIGDYKLPSDRQRLKKQAEELLAKYQTNLDSALRATATRGVISKKKLLQLFKGLGIQLSQEIQSYIIGKIVIKSQNLLNLRFSLLFQK